MSDISIDIVSRFGLKRLSPSEKNIGRSFINNIAFYEWPTHGYFAKCDGHGDPLPENRIMFFTKEGSIQFSERFLLDIPVDEINKLIKEKISSNA